MASTAQHNSHERTSRSGRWLLFALLQVILLASLAAAAMVRDRQWNSSRQLPALRSTPRQILPRFDRPEVISDEQLRAVLLKLRPALTGREPKINHVDHALRFWGIEAKFTDARYLDGAALRSLLLDHRQFDTAWGNAARPLLINTREGVQVRTREGNATASHTDHTLAGLAEVGTPLDYPVRTIAGETNLAALVKASLATFSLNQGEYEWSTLIYALYLERLDGWQTREGQQLDFNTLSNRLMREELREGVCLGNHRLYTLAVLLQLDEREPCLTATTRERVIAHLQSATATLVRHQHAYGYWDGNWTKQPAGSSDDLKEVGTRLLATGHALEWWAIAPAEVQPPREVLVRAGQWLSQTILSLDEQTVTNSYTYLTHAGHALALWRNTTPAAALTEVSE